MESDSSDDFWDDSNVGALDVQGVGDGSTQLGVGHAQHKLLFLLGQVGLNEVLEIWRSGCVVSISVVSSLREYVVQCTFYF